MALNRPLLDDRLKITVLGSADVPAILYQRVGKFLFDKEILDTKYLLYFFRSPLFVHWLKDQLQGISIPFINKSKMLKCPLLPLVDISTQLEIVARLDEEMSKIDTLSFEISQTLDRLYGMKQSILSKAFKGELV